MGPIKEVALDYIDSGRECNFYAAEHKLTLRVYNQDVDVESIWRGEDNDKVYLHCGCKEFEADIDIESLSDENQERVREVLARVNDPGLAKPVAVPMEKFKVTVIFGEYAARAYGNGGVKEMIEHMDEGQLMVREFDTEAERRAYIMGVDDSDGWLGAAVLSDKDAESAIVKELLDE